MYEVFAIICNYMIHFLLFPTNQGHPKSKFYTIVLLILHKQTHTWCLFTNKCPGLKASVIDNAASKHTILWTLLYGYKTQPTFTTILCKCHSSWVYLPVLLYFILY